MGHHGAGGAIVHSANDPRLRSVLEQLHPVDISIITTSGCENKEMATLPVCEQLRRGSVFTLPRPDRHGLNSSYTPANLIKLPSAGELAGYLQFMFQAQGSVRTRICDGLAVAEELRRSDPAAFDLLSTVHLTHSLRTIHYDAHGDYKARVPGGGGTIY